MGLLRESIELQENIRPDQNESEEVRRLRIKNKELQRTIQQQSAYLSRWGTGKITREELDDGLDGLLGSAKDVLYESLRNPNFTPKAARLIKMIQGVAGLYLDNELYKDLKREKEMNIIDSNPEYKDIIESEG